MNKEMYLKQIFYEGLGKTVYMPLKKIIDKKIKKERLNSIITIILKVLYLIISIFLGLLYLYYNWF